MTVAKIEVTGLRDLQRALREVDAQLPKQLRLVLNEASELVLGYARSHIPSRTGKARSSLKARSSQREARVALGSRAAPYGGWLDFGGEGRRKGRPTHRTFIREGRYVYKGLAVHRSDVQGILAKGLADVARGAGLEVT